MAASTAATISLSAPASASSRVRAATRRAASLRTRHETPARGPVARAGRLLRDGNASSHSRDCVARTVIHAFRLSVRTICQSIGPLFFLGSVRQRLLLQTVSFEEPVQRRAINAGKAGGAGHIPAGEGDDLLEVLPLEARQQTASQGTKASFRRAINAERPRGRRIADRLILPDHRDILGLNLTARLDQHDGMLDHVLKLAHVAAPRPDPQRTHSRLREPRERRTRVAVATP